MLRIFFGIIVKNCLRFVEEAVPIFSHERGQLGAPNFVKCYIITSGNLPLVTIECYEKINDDKKAELDGTALTKPRKGDSYSKFLGNLQR